MKSSHDIANILEEISSLSHSIVVFHLFALITEKGFLISPCYSLALCIQNSGVLAPSIGCILSPCLFNLYAEYIMRNTGLEETQAGIKIAGRNINNLRYADDTTLMAESEEELKSLLMKVKVECEKVGLKLNI